MRCTITLPWPPSTNHYWGNRIVMPRHGRPFVNTYLTAAAKAFRAEVEARILQRFGVLKPLECRLSIRVVARMPDRRVRDLSNLLKAAEDALTHARVWADDSLLDRITIERGPIVKGGELVVTIERIEDGRPAQRELALAKLEDVE